MVSFKQQFGAKREYFAKKVEKIPQTKNRSMQLTVQLVNRRQTKEKKGQSACQLPPVVLTTKYNT